MKLISWNVNGIRAIAKKDFAENIKELNADIICLQEVKATPEQTEEALLALSGYSIITNSAQKKGYAGTSVLAKTKWLNNHFGMGIAVHDNAGRLITVEFAKFYLINVYVPNSGRGLVKLDYRKTWDADMMQYVNNLQKQKPVIICGDMNVAHQPIDIARPKANYNKTAGYTQTEIDDFAHLLKTCNLIDSFRHLHPDKVKYSWWSYRAGARTKNIGWRLDYFLINKNLLTDLQASFILNDYLGSDHCPVGITLK